MSAREVTFCLRADAVAKPGGDSSKAERLAAGLKLRGIETKFAYSIAEMQNAHSSVVHLVNLDLPLENLAYARVAHRMGARVVLSSVMHPQEGLREFYTLGDDLFYRGTSRIGIPFDQGVVLREVTKMVMRKRLDTVSLALRKRLHYTELQTDLVNAVDLVLPMNNLEKDAIKSTLQCPDSKLRVVPNGTTFQTAPSSGKRDYDVIVVGRIEPRKNSLHAAKILQKTGLRCLFVGALNENHEPFSRAFLDLVRASSTMEYCGRQKSSVVRELLARSVVYLNLSWVEVVSQADIEAATQGCQVLTTKNSYVAAHLGGIEFIDPAKSVLSPETSVETIRHTAESAKTTAEARWLPSWDDSAELLDAAYKVLGV